MIHDEWTTRLLEVREENGREAFFHRHVDHHRMAFDDRVEETLFDLYPPPDPRFP